MQETCCLIVPSTSVRCDAAATQTVNFNAYGNEFEVSYCQDHWPWGQLLQGERIETRKLAPE